MQILFICFGSYCVMYYRLESLYSGYFCRDEGLLRYCKDKLRLCFRAFKWDVMLYSDYVLFMYLVIYYIFLWCFKGFCCVKLLFFTILSSYFIILQHNILSFIILQYFMLYYFRDCSLCSCKCFIILFCVI